VVFRPETAPRSFRTQGTVTTALVAAGRAIGWEATTTVGLASPRSDDSGDGPAV
jgi:hypothetical protein